MCSSTSSIPNGQNPFWRLWTFMQRIGVWWKDRKELISEFVLLIDIWFLSQFWFRNDKMNATPYEQRFLYLMVATLSCSKMKRSSASSSHRISHDRSDSEPISVAPVNRKELTMRSKGWMKMMRHTHSLSYLKPYRRRHLFREPTMNAVRDQESVLSVRILTQRLPIMMNWAEAREGSIHKMWSGGGNLLLQATSLCILYCELWIDESFLTPLNRFPSLHIHVALTYWPRFRRSG